MIYDFFLVRDKQTFFVFLEYAAYEIRTICAFFFSLLSFFLSCFLLNRFSLVAMRFSMCLISPPSALPGSPFLSILV